MFCLECDIHIVIYSKDLICKREQCYILLKKILIFIFCLLVLIKHEGYHCVCSVYLSVFIVYGYMFLGIIFC